MNNTGIKIINRLSKMNMNRYKYIYIIVETVTAGSAEALRQRRFWPQDFFAAKMFFC